MTNCLFSLVVFRLLYNPLSRLRRQLPLLRGASHKVLNFIVFISSIAKESLSYGRNYNSIGTLLRGYPLSATSFAKGAERLLNFTFMP